MRKSTLSCFVVPLLPIGMSVFLFINYVNTVNGGIRIPSEMGYYLFLIMVVLSSLLFAIMQQCPSSKETALKYIFQVNLFLLVAICLDMILHIMARDLTRSPNTSNGLADGIHLNLPLIQSAWRIYGARLITVLIIGNVTFWGITKIIQMRLK